MPKKALLIGNSDGIGLAVTRQLLDDGWQIYGISRSSSEVADPKYTHTVIDVSDPEYLKRLGEIQEDAGPFGLCIYCVGIGQLLNLSDMDSEVRVVEVNLLALIKTTSVIIPAMVEQNSGHFAGLSSVADAMLSAEAPSYHASKAGFSNYLESLALALKNTAVNISNIRLGFVDTKMAKGDKKPFMMSTEHAAKHVLRCIDKKIVRYTAPKVVIPLVKFRDVMLRLGNW
jgi:short-subunit dehydrogenase